MQETFFFFSIAPAMNQARSVSLHSTLAKPSLTEVAPKARAHALDRAEDVGGVRGLGSRSPGQAWLADLHRRRLVSTYQNSSFEGAEQNKLILSF